MRRVLLFAILAGCLGVGVLPALADDQGVTVADNAFMPNRVAVKPGEMVTWTNPAQGNPHSVHFEGQPAENLPSPGFTIEKTFPGAGEYRYVCDVHGFMTGTVFVNDTGVVPTPSPTTSPTTSPSPSPSASATPTTSPGGGGSTTPPPTGSAGVVVSRFTARPLRDHFCTRRSATCRRPGVFLTLDLGATDAVRVRGTLTRAPLAGGRSRRFGTVSFLVRPGRRQVKLPSRKRLTRGRYTLALKAGGLERRLRFRVVR